MGGTTFRALVEDRGLQLSDVDLGDVSRLELDAAGEGVFAAEVGDVVGPLPSSLGPALFRVNAVLPAQNTSFEEARPDLQEELARTRAIRAVEALALELDDQLAGGTTIEQLADETEMTLGQIDWTAVTSEGIAAYGDFREEASRLAPGDFPQIKQLDDGSVYAMRLDEELPERPEPFEEAIDSVRTAWEAQQTATLLTAQAEAALADLSGEGAFEAAGFDAVIETDQTRNGFINGTPVGFMSEVFEMAPGEVRIIPGEGDIAIVRLDEITAASEDPQNVALSEQLGAQINQALAQDLFNIYADDVVRRAVPQVDQRALQAVHVNFP